MSYVSLSWLPTNSHVLFNHGVHCFMIKILCLYSWKWPIMSYI